MSLLTLFGGTIFQGLDDNGRPVPSGKVNFYEAGNIPTRKDTYADANKGATNANPVVLDGAGRAVIFLDNDGAYDIVFTDHNGATIWTLSAVIAAAPAV